jgi:P-type conjugative transfer protein TrbJ
LQRLQQDAQSADGQQKAIQVGNEIAAEQVSQLIQLRELMMADIQSKAAFQAKQIADEDEAKRAAGFFSSTDKTDGHY